jgi:hypothetical protein
MKNLLTLVVLMLTTFVAVSQDFGYFGKKNLVGVHGTWFFRSMPQYFHPEQLYRFDEKNNDLKNNTLRNHVWHSGLSYKRILSKSHAIGIQAELYTRNLGDPIHDRSNKLNYQAEWALTSNSLDLVYAWSKEIGEVVQLWDLDITPTSINVLDLKALWSRSRTLSVFPLGLTSTWGIGYQYFSVDYTRRVHARAFTMDWQSMETADIPQTFLVNKAPTDLVNNYWGIAWMWDLSLNYALNKNWLLSFGSDIRGTFLVQQSRSSSDMALTFPNDNNSLPVLEGLIYGRNMNREIRKEMVFQNTFRLGLIFAF